MRKLVLHLMKIEGNVAIWLEKALSTELSWKPDLFIMQQCM